MEQNELFYNVCNDLWAFAKVSYKPERQYKHIDVGAGVDIDELLDILESTDDF